MAWSFCGLGKHSRIPGAACFIVTVHLPYGFFGEATERFRFGRAVRSCGYELDPVYPAALLVITLQGPVPPSIDHMLRPNVHIVKEDPCSHSTTASRPE